MSKDISMSATRSKLAIGAAAIALCAFAVIFALALRTPVHAAETVLVRGVVKSGGSSDSINLYITHIATAPDPTAIRGIRTDVNVSKAKIYKWEVKNGGLTKVRTTSIPTPEKEVVVRGTLLDDNRITAAWVVQNYREFTVEGTLEGSTLDTGSTTEGWVTVNVNKSIFRNVSPERAFKEERIEGKDWQFRVNGTTDITALGKSKSLDEVTSSNQKVKIEGQLNDEDVWVISKLYELN